MKIKNTNDIDAHYLKALVFSPSGHGKTTLAKTLGSYKTLIISAESGLLSLQGSDIDVIDITRDDKDELIEDKKSRLLRLAEIYKFLLTDKKYQCVFIDSLSELSQTMVEALQKEFPDRKDSLVLWGQNVKRMRALIKCFRDLPDKHVFVTCLSEIEKDDIGKRFTTVDLAGKISKELAAFFDLVMYLNVNADGKRTLITQPTDKMVCKDRSGRLLQEEEADLSLIIKKVLLPKEKK
jgi:phage nucleotide-binding protein